ncbi:MAG: molecular chaperone TorD family protein [Planctomycetota bacterium]|jgi:DMSO reductase family type II enzyme chaperone|nr:molecular chaperone TorD family protein [Planctomycetota bacterium]MDP6503781.1 molecular chaperone TorD family protein [Planctomycetota bacterium]
MTTTDTTIARSQVYAFFGNLFHWPDEESFDQLCRSLDEELPAAFDALGLPGAREILEASHSTSYEEYRDDYQATFGHTIQSPCPPYEAEYGSQVLDFRQCIELGDIAGFFRAFGLKISGEFHDRPDHIVPELEFMALVTFKEAFALENGHPDEHAEACREAQQRFLDEHLAQWVPAFAVRLETATPSSLLQAAASMLREFINQECEQLDVPLGDEELSLRVFPFDADDDFTECSDPNKAFVPVGAVTKGSD